MKRRSVLLGTAGLAGAGWLLRPTDTGENHAPYFQALSEGLGQQGRAVPTLVIDRNALHENIATLKRHIDDRFAYRIVAKSLPSLPLLEEVMKYSGSNRLMLFNQPFINQVAVAFPEADVLLGKPMPVAAARSFYAEYSGGPFTASQQLHWLLDTPERVRQYAALASELGETLSICIELDVGLHRGGVSNDFDFLEMLTLLQGSEHLKFRGLMGYEPHIVKVPGNPETYRDASMAAYSHYLELARNTLAADWPVAPILNAAGSPTYQLYDRGDYPFNELAAGSCLVKPSDFDLPSLEDHIAASYIAAPVLKRLEQTRIPGIDLGKLQAMWNPNRERAFFTYGGYWKAEPVSPRGLSTNPLYGRSTNQELFNGSSSVDLQPDDWVFLRPTQSEFVFLQFGDIAVYEAGRVTEQWPVFMTEA
jgi:D-serine deaminase-like pyridoxal phosphate-dependent protein